jgi:hypothetical protein
MGYTTPHCLVVFSPLDVSIRSLRATIRRMRAARWVAAKGPTMIAELRPGIAFRIGLVGRALERARRPVGT